MQSTVTLTGSDLMIFNLADDGGPIRPSGFGTQFGPHQKVEVIYSSDRSLPPFTNLPREVGGWLQRHSYKQGAEAYALVYVLAEITPPAPAIRTGGLGSPMLSVAAEPPREKTVRLLAHELAHVRQAWMLSRDFDDQYKQAGPYNQNIYEKAAYSVADRFMNQNRSRIKAGTFDRLLPSWITQAK